MKCTVVSFEKEAKCPAQENLTTTRSLNRTKKKIERKKFIVRSNTKPQDKSWFCGFHL